MQQLETITIIASQEEISHNEKVKWAVIQRNITLLEIKRILSCSDVGKREVDGVPQSQAVAHPRYEEEEETNKIKQTQIKQTY